MGVAAGGWSIPLRFSRGRVPRGQATGRPEQIPARGPGSEEVQGGSPHPSQVGPLGSRLELGQQEHGVGESLSSALQPRLSTPPRSPWHPLFLSLLQPPGANIISPSLPFLVFPPLTLRSAPTPAPPAPPTPPPAPPRDLGTDAADRPCQLKGVRGRKSLPVWPTWPPAPGTRPQWALLRGPRIKGCRSHVNPSTPLRN